jgi:hypothetical protein
MSLHYGINLLGGFKFKVKLLLTGIFSTFDNLSQAKVTKNDSVNTLLIQEFNRKLSIIDGQHAKTHQR